MLGGATLASSSRVGASCSGEGANPRGAASSSPQSASSSPLGSGFPLPQHQHSRRIGKVVSSSLFSPTAMRRSAPALASPISLVAAPQPPGSSLTNTSASPSRSSAVVPASSVPTGISLFSSSFTRNGSSPSSSSGRIRHNTPSISSPPGTPGAASSSTAASTGRSASHCGSPSFWATRTRSSTGGSPSSISALPGNGTAHQQIGSGGAPSPAQPTASNSPSTTSPFADRHSLVTATLPQAVSIIPGRFYWIVRSSNWTPGPGELTQGLRFHFFSIDKELVYNPFYADFGPLNLAQTWRYCQKVKRLLDEDPADCVIVHRCSPDPTKKANAAYLAAAFQVICLKRPPVQAMRPFEEMNIAFTPFRDATYGPSTYQLNIIECLRGIAYAMELGWFSYETFDIESYEFYEKIVNGDLNWIIPKKFVAFSGPTALASALNEDGIICMSPESHIPVFKRLGVTLVVRLNKKQYCRKVFTRQGIAHADLYFSDGSCPARELVKRFITICEREPGAVAVHCKAGLGRTGTLIGCYAMKNYGFAAGPWIGWNRICRPGSVLGPQQQFLHEIQHEMHEWGLPPIPISPATSATVGYNYRSDWDATPISPEEQRVARSGDVGQAERLLQAKRLKSAMAGIGILPNDADDFKRADTSGDCNGESYSPSAAASRSTYMREREGSSAVGMQPITQYHHGKFSSAFLLRLEATTSAENDSTATGTELLR